jgi:hypothetical protein
MALEHGDLTKRLLKALHSSQLKQVGHCNMQIEFLVYLFMFSVFQEEINVYTVVIKHMVKADLTTSSDVQSDSAMTPPRNRDLSPSTRVSEELSSLHNLERSPVSGTPTPADQGLQQSSSPSSMSAGNKFKAPTDPDLATSNHSVEKSPTVEEQIPFTSPEKQDSVSTEAVTFYINKDKDRASRGKISELCPDSKDSGTTGHSSARCKDRRSSKSGEKHIKRHTSSASDSILPPHLPSAESQSRVSPKHEERIGASRRNAERRPSVREERQSARDHSVLASCQLCSHKNVGGGQLELRKHFLRLHQRHLPGTGTNIGTLFCRISA